MRPLLLVCLLASVASADGYYFTEGVGNTHIADQLSHFTQGGVRVRFGFGKRVGPWAVEAWVAGVSTPDSVVTPAGVPDLITYGVDLKYLQPIARHVDFYVRGTVSGASTDGALDGYAGRGLGAGAGIQLKGRLPPLGHRGPRVTVALWLDTGYEFYRLHGAGPEAIDAQVTNLTGGMAVGGDF